MSSDNWVAIALAAVSVVASLTVVILTAKLSTRTKRLEQNIADESRAKLRAERYQEPLVLAAEQLRSRVWNIRNARFLERYLLQGSEAEAEYARNSTLWFVGLYVCFEDILEREVQYLTFQGEERTRLLQRHIHDVRKAFATDKLEPPFRVFRTNQKAIGEVVRTVERDAEGNDRTGCMGFSEFSTCMQDEGVNRWLNPLASDIQFIARNPAFSRLQSIESALESLVLFVDDQGIRFPHPSRQPGASARPRYGESDVDGHLPRLPR